MKDKFSISKVIGWLKSTEMFARSSELLPGNWLLTEYYIDSANGLENFSTLQLKNRNEFWKINFGSENKFSAQISLPVAILVGFENGTWKIMKNYMTLINVSSNDIQFQFAIDQGRLKLLKKDSKGMIVFFGIFDRIN